MTVSFEQLKDGRWAVAVFVGNTKTQDYVMLYESDARRIYLELTGKDAPL